MSVLQFSSIPDGEYRPTVESGSSDFIIKLPCFRYTDSGQPRNSVLARIREDIGALYGLHFADNNSIVMLSPSSAGENLQGSCIVDYSMDGALSAIPLDPLGGSLNVVGGPIITDDYLPNKIMNWQIGLRVASRTLSAYGFATLYNDIGRIQLN